MLRKTAGRRFNAPCDSQAATQLKDGTIHLRRSSRKKTGDIYKLHGDVEIHYRTYMLRADEVTYDSDSGEATTSGHFTLDGGPNDDHIKASHGTYNLTAETGRFYDVTATTGMSFQRQGRSLPRRLRSPSPERALKNEFRSLRRL